MKIDDLWGLFLKKYPHMRDPDFVFSQKARGFERSVRQAYKEGFKEGVKAGMASPLEGDPFGFGRMFK